MLQVDQSVNAVERDILGLLRLSYEMCALCGRSAEFAMLTWRYVLQTTVL